MVNYKIELVIVPVADVDRSRAFYGETLGWPVDHDQTVDENVRFVQVTPPGSACSIAFGRGLSEMEPGSLRALQAVVGSGIFKSGNPAERASAIVKATTFYDDPDVIAMVSRGLGEAMVGINVDEIPQPHRLAERGW